MTVSPVVDQVDQPVDRRALAAPALVAQSALVAPLAPVLLAGVICQDELRSARTGRLTVCDLAYVWSTPALPLRIDLDVVTLWWIRALDHAHRFVTRVRDLDGGVLDLVELEIAFEGLSVHEHMARFVGLEFKAAGVYRVEVLLDDEVAGTYPLFVQVTAADPAGGQGDA